MILSPWNYGASAEPKTNFTQITQNLRVFATIIYEICRYGEKDIPPIPRTTSSTSSAATTTTSSGVNNDNNDNNNTKQLLNPHDVDENSSLTNNIFMDSLIHLVDLIMGQTHNLLNKHQTIKNSIENHKKTYDTINNIHELLLKNEIMDEIKNELKGIIKELAEKLNKWILNITTELVTKKINDEKILKLE